MSFWITVKNILRRFVPAGRVYIDTKFKILEAGAAKEKSIRELQRTVAAQTKAIEELKEYVDQELSRRDDWGKRAAEIVRTAAGRPVWVIKCPAPGDARKVAWGDYAYANALKKYLDRLGVYTIVDTKEDWDCQEDADVVLVLRGCHFYRPDRRKEHCLYIMWNISHPEMVTPEEYELYDLVCICSRHYAKEIAQRVKVPVISLAQCTDTEVFYPPEEGQENRDQGLVFIGNSRGVARQCVMWAVQEKLPLKIWGKEWRHILGENVSMVQAETVENDEIPDLYRSAKATLNDHWKDMLDCQFVNNRIFDALACGLPVVSDCCDELREIFPDAVLYYRNKEEFQKCIETLETDYSAVRTRVAAQWPLIKEKYSFEGRAKELIEIAEKYREKKEA